MRKSLKAVVVSGVEILVDLVDLNHNVKTIKKFGSRRDPCGSRGSKLIILCQNISQIMVEILVDLVDLNSNFKRDWKRNKYVEILVDLVDLNYLAIDSD